MPVPRERGRDGGLREEREGGREAEQERSAPHLPEAHVAHDGETEQRDPEDGDGDERAGRPFRNVVEPGQQGEREHRPDAHRDEQGTLEPAERAADAVAAFVSEIERGRARRTRRRRRARSASRSRSRRCSSRGARRASPARAARGSRRRRGRRARRGTRGRRRVRRAATPVAYASALLSAAADSVSQKCEGWCSQWTSASGAEMRTRRPTTGTARRAATGISGVRPNRS